MGKILAENPFYSNINVNFTFESILHAYTRNNVYVCVWQMIESLKLSRNGKVEREGLVYLSISNNQMKKINSLQNRDREVDAKNRSPSQTRSLLTGTNQAYSFYI